MAALPIPILDPDKRTAFIKKYRTQVATAPAAAIAIITGSPLENVKTRMQSRHFNNALDCARYTFRTEGYRGFWSGSITPIFMLTFTRLACFSIYQTTKYALNDVIRKQTGQSPLDDVNKPGTYPNLATVTCFTISGMVAGAGQAVIGCPFEVAKNAAQTSVLMSGSATDPSVKPPTGVTAAKNVGKLNSVGAVKQIVRNRGFGALYSGFKLHLARDTLGTGMYFSVYEATKQSIRSYQGADKANTQTAIAAAGFICGAGSWLCTYPLDTMKTRLQSTLLSSTSESAKQCVESTVRSSRFKGVEIMLLRSSVQNCIQMLIFEYVKVKINEAKFSDGSTKPKRQGSRA